jgi:uncharacterized membrane protein
VILDKDSREHKTLLRQHTVCYALLVAGVVVYCVTFCHLTFSLYDRFGMMAFDFGIFHQAVWLMANGETPFVTLRGTHILGDHFSVILYLIAPVYALIPHPKTLLVLQTVALALGAFPVYGLARRVNLTPPLALLFAFAYLLYPPLQWSNTYEFHPDIFATPLLLTALYCLVARRWWGYIVALVLTALTKESVGITIACIGVLMWRTDRRIAGATVALGIASLVIALLTVRQFNEGQPSPYWWLYSRWGDNPQEIVVNLISKPHQPLSSLLQSWQYFWLLLSPLCCLSLLATPRLFPALPVVLSNLLTSRPFMHGVEEHYTALITPFIFWAAIEGCAKVYRWSQERFPDFADYIRLAVAINLALWSLGTTMTGPLFCDLTEKRGGLPVVIAQDTRKTLSVIPPDASVSAQFALGSQLSGRRTIYLQPNPFIRMAYGGTVESLKQVDAYGGNPLPPEAEVQRAIEKTAVDYIVFSPLTYTYPLSFNDHAIFAIATLKSSKYSIVQVGVASLVLKRGADREAGLRLFSRVTGVAIDSESDIEAAYWHWMATQSEAIVKEKKQ